MGKAYYTLVIKERGKWFIQFGDYSKAAVKQEREGSYGDCASWEWRIIKTGDTQAEIEAAVDVLNKGF
jgi:hypothetical protein